MKRPNRDLDREDRIHNEVIADANGPEEQVMGWHCYLDDNIRFPFQATCIAVKIVSPLRKGESVEVLRMAPEDACSADMLVVIHWQDRTMAVPLSQLAAVDPDDSTAEAIARLALLGGTRLLLLTYARQPKAHHFPRRLAAQRVDYRILSGDRSVDRGRVQRVARNNSDVRLLVLRGAAHESRHLMSCRQRLIYQRFSAPARCSKH